MSAIDAVASFVGSYSIGLLITDKQYCTGRYTAKEAAIIATGFSTVSATFCVVVAKTLNLMDMWNLFFWATMAICFIVTAITVRLWPLKHISDEYMEGVEPYEEKIVTDGLFVAALEEGLEASNQPVSILKKMIQMASNPNDIIFDPFMGVGSTGVAALEMGRKFIGVELEKNYYQRMLKKGCVYINTQNV